MHPPSQRKLAQAIRYTSVLQKFYNGPNQKLIGHLRDDRVPIVRPEIQPPGKLRRQNVNEYRRLKKTRGYLFQSPAKRRESNTVGELSSPILKS